MVRLLLMLFACMFVLASGCAMCEDACDECYSTYGGLLPLEDDLSERVSYSFGTLSDVKVPERASGTPEMAPETDQEEELDMTDEDSGRVTWLIP